MVFYIKYVNSYPRRRFSFAFLLKLGWQRTENVYCHSLRMRKCCDRMLNPVYFNLSRKNNSVKGTEISPGHSQTLKTFFLRICNFCFAGCVNFRSDERLSRQ